MEDCSQFRFTGWHDHKVASGIFGKREGLRHAATTRTHQAYASTRNIEPVATLWSHWCCIHEDWGSSHGFRYSCHFATSITLLLYLCCWTELLLWPQQKSSPSTWVPLPVRENRSQPLYSLASIRSKNLRQWMHLSVECLIRFDSTSMIDDWWRKIRFDSTSMMTGTDDATVSFFNAGYVLPADQKLW